MNPASLLVNWYQSEGRDLPWRNTKNPYKIWVSEIILQQTRVDQGKGYYLRFIKRFPSLATLANAELDEVLKYWEGLGYYSRARNLHFTSKELIEKYNGNFPNTREALLALKGIGPYTASAIASIVFGEATASLDGNVFRVTSRYLADSSPIDLPQTRKYFQSILDGWIKKENPADFNQAIMDLGATVCTPRNPDCRNCPLSKYCKARKEGAQMSFPVKAKKLKRKKKYFQFYLIRNKADEILVRRRAEKGLWGGLWEIPNEEKDHKVWRKKEQNHAEYLGELKHVFTHIDMHIRIYGMRQKGQRQSFEGKFIPEEKISIFAFSRAVQKIFDAYLPDFYYIKAKLY